MSVGHIRVGAAMGGASEADWQVYREASVNEICVYVRLSISGP